MTAKQIWELFRIAIGRGNADPDPDPSMRTIRQIQSIRFPVLLFVGATNEL
jgi:hypothetical protein